MGQRLVVIGVVLLATGLAATAAAVPVQGRLTIPNDFGRPATEARCTEDRRCNWEQWNGFIAPVPFRIEAPRALAVVLLGPGEGEPRGCTFALRGGDLYPQTMVARVGQNLRIENTDAFPHELFADGIENFTALSTASGNARTQPLAAAGHFVIRDRLYGHIEGHLHVVPNLLACAQVNPDGSFSFGEVAPGSYTVKVFHRDRDLVTSPIEVQEGRELVLEPIALGGGGGG